MLSINAPSQYVNFNFHHLAASRNYPKFQFYFFSKSWGAFANKTEIEDSFPITNHTPCIHHEFHSGSYCIIFDASKMLLCSSYVQNILFIQFHYKQLYYIRNLYTLISLYPAYLYTIQIGKIFAPIALCISTYIFVPNNFIR